MMKITQIKENDINAILDLIVQYKQEQHISMDSIFKNNIRKQLLKLIKKNDSTSYICTLKNKVVGYMNTHICLFPLLGGSELYISDLLINQNFRGKGIGKLFIAKAEELAKKVSV